MRTLGSMSGLVLVAGLLAVTMPTLARGQASLASEPPAANGASGSAASAGAEAGKDPRPLVRLAVKNEFRPEDKLFAQLVEGRLVSDLADMETFRTIGGESGTGDFFLTCTIRNISYDAATVYNQSRDADAPSTPQATNQVTLSMELMVRLADRAAKEIYSGKLSVQASRDFEISARYTGDLLNQEMIDRAAQKIERIVRKKLRAP